MTRVITRFAPSPTGKMHIGNARTALFNYLYAKHTKGDFLLRIEDTDKERSTDENIELIFGALNAMGLEYDGVPVIQSMNLERHTEIAHELISRGMAYRAYDTKEELTQMREAAEKNKTSFRYSSIWQNIPHPPYPENKPYVVRIRNTYADDYPITITDMVQGEVTRLAKEVDDFIILRSDGTPTYLLSVVVDDHDAGVNTIIRGDDHLTNTFRQYLIWDAMGWEIPSYGHVPLINGPDGKKLSKRHGSTSIEDLSDMGFGLENMPGIINYLATLGWTPKPDKISSSILHMSNEELISYLNEIGWDFSGEMPDISKISEIFSNNKNIDSSYKMNEVFSTCESYFLSLGGKYTIPEIYTMEKLIDKFDIKDVNKSPAQFDIKKLKHINGIWMNRVNLDTFEKGFYDYLDKMQSNFLYEIRDNKEVFELIIPSLPIRAKTFEEAYEMVKYLSPSIYLANIADKDLGKDKEICKNVIKIMTTQSISVMDAAKQYAEQHNLKLKNVAGSIREVFTGQKISPPLNDIIREKTLTDFNLKTNGRKNSQYEI